MMSGLNPSHATLFLVLIFSFKLSQCVENITISCPDIEKQSLLTFKQSLKDYGNTLSSWDSEINCCKWKGVVCNNFTGHVHQLHLQSLRGKIDPSLLNLKQLRYLDLSLNDFGDTIPSFIGSFTYLEYLNFSLCAFRGLIPSTLGNLSHLHTLDLSTDLGLPYPYGLYADSLEWLSGISKLEYLNMNDADLSRATDWAKVINTLPSLVHLHFQSCSLEYVSSLDDVNVTSLRFLDLSRNLIFVSSMFPSWIFQLPNLLFLDISLNYYEGLIPTISNATKLQYLDLSYNNFNSSIPDSLFLCTDLEFVSLTRSLTQAGTIPTAIGNLTSLKALLLGESQLSGKIPTEFSTLCKLKWLDLSDNELEGEIGAWLGNMSECFLEALEELYLGINHLSGELTDNFVKFKRLRILSLDGNKLSGVIPTVLGKLACLEKLFLQNNTFSGNLPESLGQLSNLKELNIGGNRLEGDVTESHFANLTKLERLLASGNRLSLKVGVNWIPPFQLQDLVLRSWNLSTSSHILKCFEKRKFVSFLDLSNTGISGNVPTWIWESWFIYLNLSHNHLQGKIPYIRGDESYLSSNQFSGSLPQITQVVSNVDLSDNSFSGGMSHFLCNRTYQTYGLGTLHLGGNQLGGELPDCWKNWTMLRYLNLGNNNMYGSIPASFGYLKSLVSLNLYGNKFSGQIPFSMHNCTQLFKIDLSDNELEGSIPTWMGTSLVELQFLILRSNQLSGEISPAICQLNSLQILDLSDNKLSGKIPSCVDNFTAMATPRNLDNGLASYSGWGYLTDSASIATKGSELLYDTILFLVTSFDLSKNNLSGEIPKELTSLVELRSLNLSGNHLTGSIPDRIGDMKQLESLDFSTNSLSGQIPNSFTIMSSLSYLNLSYNNLSGKIPESTQLRGFDAWSFTGNNLCGPPLTSNCGQNGDEVPTHKDEDGSDESAEIECFYVLLSSGYAVGLSIVCSVFVVKKSWRSAYFGWLECMWDKLYVFVYVNWRRLIKPPKTSS